MHKNRRKIRQEIQSLCTQEIQEQGKTVSAPIGGRKTIGRSVPAFHARGFRHMVISIRWFGVLHELSLGGDDEEVMTNLCF